LSTYKWGDRTAAFIGNEFLLSVDSSSKKIASRLFCAAAARQESTSLAIDGRAVIDFLPP
jgi:hypothetical protein